MGKVFLKHEYNRDGDSYRSPWSNQYFPKTESTFYPSAHLLQLEQKANAMFATYVKLYYDFAQSSVYFVDTQDPGFNACFLVKKDINDEKDIKKGCWDAIHVVTCNLKKAPKATYRVISTVMITIDAVSPKVGSFVISGSCAKTTDETVTLPADFGTKVDADHFHIKTVGKIIENNESMLRNDVVENYINKQRQITNTARLMEEYMSREEKQKFQMELAAAAKAVQAQNQSATVYHER